MTSGRNMMYYAGAVILFLALKLWYTRADTSDLLFLLAPTNTFIEVITGSTAVFSTESGFFHADMGIAIDKSCSGYNFWILCFLVFTLPTLSYIRTTKRKLALFPLMLLLGYAATIVANTSRIIVAITMGSSLPMFPQLRHEWIHEAQGVLVYLLFLILFSLLLQQFLSSWQKNYVQST